MQWFRKLLDERLRVLEEDFIVRRGASPTEARAWFELQAKEIAAMAFLWDDSGYTAAQLDEFRRRMAEGNPSESAPSAPEMLEAAPLPEEPLR